MFPVLYSPNEPEHFLGFFTSWIQIQEAYLYADPDPKHCFEMKTNTEPYFSILSFIILPALFALFFFKLITQKAWRAAAKAILFLQLNLEETRNKT